MKRLLFILLLSGCRASTTSGVHEPKTAQAATLPPIACHDDENLDNGKCVPRMIGK